MHRSSRGEQTTVFTKRWEEGLCIYVFMYLFECSNIQIIYLLVLLLLFITMFTFNRLVFVDKRSPLEL